MSVAGLGPFLESLEQRLEALTADELRSVLLDHAARLPAADRVAFLAIFISRSTHAHPADASDPDLVGDVESFIADIADGAYVDGWGYDRDYRDHRAFGDETWTVVMDDLLDRSGSAFLAGDVAAAREAYRGLLAALGGEYDEGGFPGAGTPEELLRSDVAEAKNRYLRATWEAEPVGSRAAALLQVIEALIYVGDEPSLAALDATRRTGLPDLDAVLPDLIAALRAVDPAVFPFGRQARRLLAEATERHRGVDGLAELARAPGANRPDAYCDWVDGLARTGRLGEAEQAALEALQQLESYGPVQAGIAERLAVLSAARDDGGALLDARVAAWRADPTVARLVNLVDVATALDRRAEVVAAEAGRTAADPLAARPALAASVLLLAGRAGHATALLVGADPVGWSGHHPGPVVVPFLLIGGSGAAGDPRWDDLLLGEALDAANSVGWPYDALGGDDGLEAFRGLLPSTGNDAGRFHGIPRDVLLLSALLLAALDEHPIRPDERRKWLEDARRHVDARVGAVVGGKHRRAYQSVAHLVAACAEALALGIGAAEAHRYVDGVNAAYPRHSAFRRELASIVAQSPLLR